MHICEKGDDCESNPMAAVCHECLGDEEAFMCSLCKVSLCSHYASQGELTCSRSMLSDALAHSILVWQHPMLIAGATSSSC